MLLFIHFVVKYFDMEVDHVNGSSKVQNDHFATMLFYITAHK